MVTVAVKDEVKFIALCIPHISWTIWLHIYIYSLIVVHNHYDGFESIIATSCRTRLRLYGLILKIS